MIAKSVIQKFLRQSFLTLLALCMSSSDAFCVSAFNVECLPRLLLRSAVGIGEVRPWALLGLILVVRVGEIALSSPLLPSTSEKFFLAAPSKIKGGLQGLVKNLLFLILQIRCKLYKHTFSLPKVPGISSIKLKLLIFRWNILKSNPRNISSCSATSS